MNKKILFGLIAAFSIIAAIIYIGPLVYFGAISPNDYLPSRCNVSPEFSCEEFQVADGSMTIVISNTVVEPMVIEMNGDIITVPFGEYTFLSVPYEETKSAYTSEGTFLYYREGSEVKRDGTYSVFLGK